MHTLCATRGIINWCDGVSSRGFRWDTGMKTNEHSWGLVPVTNQKKCAHQWWLMGIRTKITQKTRKAVRHLTSFTATLDPMEQMTRCHHHGNKHEPPYGRLTMPFGTGMRIYHTGEASSFPVSFSLNFHLCNMLIRVLYNKHRYRYRYLAVNKIPIFFFYITAT